MKLLLKTCLNLNKHDDPVSVRPRKRKKVKNKIKKKTRPEKERESNWITHKYFF